MVLKRPTPLFLIDLLKVIAALLIILHHLSSYGQVARDATSALPKIMTWCLEYGHYAVQIFLVMAGYLAAQSLSHYVESTFNSTHLVKVIVNRYLRLLVPYAAALVITVFCAWLTRFWVSDEFVGQSETLFQFLAHLFFLQGILGLDAISAGVWYVEIDWQLYAVLAILMISYPSYQALLWTIGMLAVSSLLIFNRSSQYEVYFIYFMGAYSLGVLAYLSRSYSNQAINRLARYALVVIGFIIAVASFKQFWLRNILAWCVAMVLILWGAAPYPKLNAHNRLWLKAISWGSQRSYCAFLIHFSFILLANALYIGSGLYDRQNGLIALGLMAGVILLTGVTANLLYRWVELPARKLKI